MPFPAAGDEDHDLVVGGVESDLGPRDVVDDDRVQALALELALAVGKRTVPVLGGKPDHDLAGAASGGQRAEDVLGRLELDARGALGLLELGGGGIDGTEVGHGGSHQEHIGG